MRGAAIVALLLLAGCRSEPDFDERYADARNEIANRASDIDRDLSNGMAEDEADTQAGSTQKDR